MKFSRLVMLFVLIFFITNEGFSQLRLPSVLSSNMVLQQNDSVNLWGWSHPAEKVFVTTSWNNHTDSAIATNEAKWKLKVKTPSAGGPFTITFKAGKTIQLDNVMIGEVWVASGQSNMEWSYYAQVNDFQPELDAHTNPNIRFLQVPKAGADYPQEDATAEWAVCDSNTLKSFSAVAYFFGKKLSTDLNVPVGLINTSWGGTPAEVWTPAELVNNDPALKAAAGKQTKFNWWPKDPGVTYNAMIAPFTNFSIAGAIWYQGEGNTAAPGTYGKLFTTMIDAWRNAWKKDFPFYYVQIAPFTYGANNNGNLVREQQAIASRHNNVGMVVVSDITGDTTDIHPRNKKDVGARLANWALSATYHKEGIAYKNPVYKGIEIKKDKAVISFDNVPDGLILIAKDKKVATLMIAGEDKVFYPAEGKIEKDKLIVSSKSVKAPVAVRFSFSNAGVGNLFSKEGLPVVPFRTDEWEVK
jgi:sialate O-acetylesterase